MKFLKSLFSKTKDTVASGSVTASTELRSMLLHANPNSMGIKPSESMPNVWGVLMEFWLNRAVVTIVSLADGTTSMYFSSGGSIIGSGAYPKPAAISRQFIEVAESFLSVIPQSIACPMPKDGNVRFHLLTFDGYHSIEVVESDVENISHQFFSLYSCGQKVITEIRIHTEAYAK